MPETFAPKTWANGSSGGTPITADELNRLEAGVESMDDRVTALETGPGGRKALEDVHRAVWASSPSAESGLTALAVDASTDDAPRIQAMLNYLDTTYGDGATLYVSGGTSNVNSGITLPTGVRIVGIPGQSAWDFWFAGTGAFTAITVNDIDCTPVSGLSIGGQQWDANSSTANTTANTGLSITGQGMTFSDLIIGGFNTGIDIVHENTFILTFERVVINGCMVGLDADLGRVYRSGTATGNSGEKISFSRGVIANCGTGFLASSNGLGLFFDKTSIDFTNIYGRIDNSHVYFVQCHLETNYQASPSTVGTDAGAPARYLFDLDGNPRLSMESCLFIIGAGIYTVIAAHKGPTNYGVGVVKFTNCNGVQGAIHGSAPAGTIGVGYSESPVGFDTGDTVKTVSSLFVSRWNNIKASMIMLDGWANPALTVRPTAINATHGTVTVTMSAAAPAAPTWVEVDL